MCRIKCKIIGHIVYFAYYADDNKQNIQNMLPNDASILCILSILCIFSCIFLHIFLHIFMHILICFVYFSSIQIDPALVWVQALMSSQKTLVIESRRLTSGQHTHPLSNSSITRPRDDSSTSANWALLQVMMAIISRISTIITVTYGTYNKDGYLWFTYDFLMINLWSTYADL